MEVSKSEFVAENASIKNEHENLRVLEKVWISFGEVTNQLIDPLYLSLLKLNLVRLHLICLSPIEMRWIQDFSFIFITS